MQRTSGSTSSASGTSFARVSTPARVDRDVASADASGVAGTPSFFINGRRHSGAYDLETLTAAVKAATDASASPVTAIVAPRSRLPPGCPARRPGMECRGQVERRAAVPGRSMALACAGVGTGNVPLIGLHCSHEQIPPSRLLTHVREAEAAGFRAAMSSDHFSPWSERQGESGFAWSFLGAALQATELPFGVVNAPGQRYHPAIVAQAAATLCELFPGRLWVALGTGEASNEHITGERWPPKAKRNARLRECVDVMRALFAGRGGGPRGPRARRPGAPLDAARRAAEPGRRRGERRDGALVRELGGRARDDQPAARDARARDRRVPRGRRRGEADPSPGPPQLGAETRRRRSGSPTTSGARTCFAPPLCWDLETVEQFDLAAAHVRPGGRAAGGARVRRPRPARRVAGGARRSSASSRSICTTSARTCARSSRRSASASCRSSPREAQGDERRLVEERRLLLPRRRDLPRLPTATAAATCRVSASASTT